MTQEQGRVVAIFVSPLARGAMHEVLEVQALASQGLEGDRYCTGEGSFNRDRVGHRQVTLINGRFFADSGFTYAESRRNLITEGVELMWLIGREFTVGDAQFRGLKYCDPCERPNRLAGKGQSFKEAFHDRGGLVAEILTTGLIRMGSLIIPPEKTY